MKENTLISINKNEKNPIPLSPGHNITSKNSSEKTFPKNIANITSYINLKESHTITLNVFNSHIFLYEYKQPSRYLTENQLLLIEEIKEKYSRCVLPIFDNFSKPVKAPEPLLIPNTKYNNYNKNYFTNINKISKSFFPMINSNNNNSYFSNDKQYLNQKRKRQIKELSNIEIDDKFLIEEDTGDIPPDEKSKKKTIFHLTKRKYKHFKNNINGRQKAPGRKKKNSGEIGIHNKFSKDNMMRKLKNKVMESARKLINKKIKDESNLEIRLYKEIRKIEGLYSQELNIKYNFWFYFQQLQDIFQFKMSSKYSKGDLDSNQTLIKTIFSYGQKGNFLKTRQLLEMPFHQYYHEIFLGENNNWTKIYDIEEKDNKYQLGYLVDNSNLNKESDFLEYRETIFKLAYNYEKFFLEKNPRTSSSKNNEKINNVKQIIKYINNKDYEIYKMKFIEKASIYRPELKKYINMLYNKNIKNEKNIKYNQNILLENYQNIINNDINNDIHILIKNNIINNNNINNKKKDNEKDKEKEKDKYKSVKFENNKIKSDTNQNKQIFGVIKGELFKIDKVTYNNNLKYNLINNKSDDSNNCKNNDNNLNAHSSNNNSCSSSFSTHATAPFLVKKKESIEDKKK